MSINIYGEDPPELLYKYLPSRLKTEQGEVIPYFETDHKLRFSQPSACNDIYECYPNLEKLAAPETNLFDNPNFWKNAKLSHLSSKEREIYKKRALEETSNDPSWRITTSNNFKRNYLDKKLHFLCLSESWESPAMWGLYTNNTGIALGFDLSTFKEDNSNLVFVFHKVIYNESRPEISTLEPEPDELIAIQITKSKEWEYEQEWRLSSLRREDLDNLEVSRDPEKLSVLGKEIPIDYLREIIFGVNCDQETIQQIQDIIPDHVKIYKAKQHYTSYKLDRDTMT